MSFIVEQDVEDAALEILEELGYEVVYGPDIAPDGLNPKRKSWDDVVLLEDLDNAVKRLNPNLPEEALKEAVKKVLRFESPQLLKNNERFHDFWVNGVDVEYRQDGRVKGGNVKLCDVENPENNFFKAINQFTLIENGKNRRPDVLLFVNGFPVGIIELKNPGSATATIDSAFEQIETYKAELPSLFTFNEFVIIADGTEAKIGTLTSSWEWFLPWKTIDGLKRESKTRPQLEVALRGMCNKKVLIDLMHYFIGFRKSGERTEKIIAGYHQYHAVNKAIKNTLRAVNGDKKVGVVWHTQGSGKSLSMAFYAGKIARNKEMKNPSIVVLTDRNDLDDQLFDTFCSHSQFFREQPKKIESQPELKQSLKTASGGIFFTTIQKFLDRTESKFELLTARDNVIVVADEAHRTQYGLNAKIRDNVLRYGFAKYLRDALPNASYLGFTGTPIDLSDKSTRQVFGDYIDVYDMQDALDDHRVVPIKYEAKLIKLGKNEDVFKQLDENVDDVMEYEEQPSKDYLKSKWSKVEALVGTEPRIKKVAETVVNHFETRQSVSEGKAIIVCMSRRICVDLHDAIKALRPEWYSKEDKQGVMKIVMTGSAMDGDKWQEHIRTKNKRREMGDLFKKPDSEFKLAIVRDMWLTGFDVPSLNTIYVDKPIRTHNLMQAIARVNRVYKDKQGGLVVDFLGIAEELKKAVMIYTENNGKGQPVQDIKVTIALMQKSYEVVVDMLHGYDYKKYFKADSKERMRIIPEVQEFILKQEKGKERFVKNTTKLLRTLSLASATIEAREIRDDTAFFQAISNSFMKTEIQNTKIPRVSDSAIKQLISKAITTEGVIDVFRGVGVEKPDISILSETFLENFQHVKYKNLAFEALKKLLNDEINSKFKENKVKQRKFSERLEEAIRKYQSRSVDSAQVVAELIELAKEVKKAQNEGKELGLTQEEIAFYDALADNQSARDLLGDEVLKKMAKELTALMKNSVCVDWNLRESVKANIRVMVKRLLKKYGYPPDKTAMATDLVLVQAELMGDKLAA